MRSKDLAYEDHNQLKSEVLLINHPISKDIILKFIKENPDIERLKGWISDADRNTWLVQKTRSECNFSISNYETISRLVVIYKDKIIDHLIDIKDDGSFWLNQEYFDYDRVLQDSHL